MFRELVIQSLATCFGKPIKIDGNTFMAKRGRFACFRVQVDTNKPLELGIYICGKIYQVVYENLPYRCHSCGRVGYTIDECSMKKSANATTKEKEPESDKEQPAKAIAEEEVDIGSNWLLEKAKNKEFRILAKPFDHSRRIHRLGEDQVSLMGQAQVALGKIRRTSPGNNRWISPTLEKGSFLGT